MVAEMACCTVATAAKRAARRSSSSMSSVVNELHRHGARYDPRFHSFVEEEPDCCPPPIAIVERPVVHVHPDEGVGLAPIEAARVTHGVIQRALSVVQAIGDALAQVTRNFFLNLARHVLPYDVSAEGKRKPRLLEPPGFHVSNQMQAFILVGELTLVDQQSGFDIAGEDGLLDLVEWNDDRDEVGLEKSEREIRAGHHSRNRDTLSCDVLPGHGFRGDQHWAVAIAHRCSVWKQCVSIRKVGVGMN